MFMIKYAGFDPESIAAIKPGAWMSQSKGVPVYGVIVYLKSGSTVTVESDDEGSAYLESGKAMKEWQEGLAAGAQQEKTGLIKHLLQVSSRIEDRQVEIKKKEDKLSRDLKALEKKLEAIGGVQRV